MLNNKIQTELKISFVQDQSALIELCSELAQSKVVAIDTEFVRTRTLYPKLGLLQVNNGEHLALIDPISVDNLSPFWQLLANADICKVLHACSEDLEVFLTVAQCKPVNLIDTQIMMSFLGHGLSMGYAAMIQHFTQVVLDKSESRTDWMQRPLTERQLSYARADVAYLFQVYPQVCTELKQSGWLEAARQETQLLIERKFTPIDETKLFQNVKMNWRLNPKQLNRLKYLAVWRYRKAQERDNPIGFIAKDPTLIALATHNPTSVGAMTKLSGVDTLDIRYQGRAMLTVLKHAETIVSGEYPDKIVRLDEYPGYKQIFKKVKNFISTIAEEVQLGVENLASKRQINQFLKWHFRLAQAESSKESIDVLQGWRLELFGEKLLAFAERQFTD